MSYLLKPNYYPFFLGYHISRQDYYSPIPSFSLSALKNSGKDS